MNVVLHVIRTDVRRLRWWLLAWAVPLLAATLASALKVDLLAAPRESAVRVLSLEAWLLNAVTILGWVIAARIVHADPLDGGNAFWLTRPVSARQLLAAKMAVVLPLFVLLPVALAAVAAAANGARGPLLVQFIVESAAIHLLFVLGVVLLASLTRDVARLVLAAIVGVTAWLALSAFIAFVSFGSPHGLEDRLTRFSGPLAGAALATVGSLALIGSQYLSRRSRRTAVLAAILTAAASATIAFWPWNLLTLRHQLADTRFDPGTVQPRLDFERQADAPAPIGETFFYGRFDAVGVPPGWAVVPLAVKATVRVNLRTITYSDETWTAYAGLYSTSPFGYGIHALDAIGHAAGGRWLNDPRMSPGGQERARGTIVIGFSVPWTAAGELRGGVGHYDADVTCAAFEADVVSVLPLRSGGTAIVEGMEATVFGVQHAQGAPKSFEVEVRTAQPPLFFPRLAPGIAFVLRNRSRGELLMGIAQDGRLPYTRFVEGGARVRYFNVRFSPAINVPWAVDDEWLSGAELVVVAMREAGTFTKHVQTPGLTLRQKAPTAENTIR